MITKNPRQNGRGAMKPLLKWISLLFILAGCQQPSSYELTSVGALFKDQAATALIKAEKYEDAMNLYIDMLEQEPDKAQIHSNIGVIMNQIQKPEESLRSLQHALKLAEAQKDSMLLFAINYNLGAYYGAQKKIEEALKHYQAALDINPTSKEVKTNIELLIQSENQNGQGDSKDQKDQNKDSKGDQKNQNDDKKGQDKKDEQKDQKDGQNDNKKDDQDKDQKKDESERKSSPKYKPRPFQGEQLSEGDVKKILGELRNQEQKIRANFDKKEQKDSSHEKDW